MLNESQLSRQSAAHSEPDCEVYVQCVQSSEFVIGKQTNFEGQVTIINCPDDADTPKEKIIIRDRVLSQPTGESKDAQSRTSKGRLVLKKLWKHRVILAVVCVGILITAFIGLTVFLTTATSEPDSGTNSTNHFYSKTDWGGKPAKSFVAMKLPVPYVVISHTVTSRCSHFAPCASLLRNMQDYHMSIEYADISYNFLLDSSGNIYEGRGWTWRNVKGGFTNGRNIDVAFIGDYSEDIHPSKEMMDSLGNLLAVGVERGFLSESYSLIAANATFATLSPGKNVYKIIKTWPHFDPDPEAHVKPFED